MNRVSLLSKRFEATPRITLTEISRRSGVPLSTVHAIATGVSPDPRISTFTKIQSALEALLAERQSAGKGGAPIAQPPSPTT